MYVSSETGDLKLTVSKYYSLYSLSQTPPCAHVLLGCVSFAVVLRVLKLVDGRCVGPII